MEIFERISCVTAFDNAMRSPIGLAVTNELESANPTMTEFGDFLGIKKELFNNHFPTVTDFLNRLDSLINKICITIGDSTDISVGFQQIQQKIHEKLSKYVPFTMNTKEFKDSIAFSKKVLEIIPNSAEEFNSEIEKIGALNFRPGSLAYESASTPNVDRLSDEIHRLKRDEDVEEVARLFLEFEPQAIQTTSYLKVSLPQCSPYALRIVQNFVSKCEKKPPLIPQTATALGSALNLPINPQIASNPNALRIFQNYLLAQRQKAGTPTLPVRSLSTNVKSLTTLPNSNNKAVPNSTKENSSEKKPLPVKTTAKLAATENKTATKTDTSSTKETKAKQDKKPLPPKTHSKAAVSDNKTAGKKK